MGTRHNIPTAAYYLMAAAMACSLSGCAAVSQHISGMFDVMSIHAKQQRELSSIRQDTRTKLAQQREVVMRTEAQREIEQARIEAQRQQLEAEFCIANQEQKQRQVQQQLQQRLESKVAFNVEQGLEVGELEVDMEALKALLEKREQEQNQPQNQPQLDIPKKPCSCCDQRCGCQPGLIRRLCPHCRHKPCEAEKKCGGPESFAQLQQQPQKQPLKPAEIPMRLPVKLTFGFQQPQLEQAQIRRLPPPSQPQQGGPCSKCGMPGGQCQCPSSCVDPVHSAPGSAPVSGSQEKPISPPKPEPDAEASFAPGQVFGTLFPTSTPIVKKRETMVPRPLPNFKQASTP